MTDSQQSNDRADSGMELFVFSYNRGRYLRNCIESIRRHAAHLPVTVIDDGSSDPEVAGVLQEYADHLRVVRSTDAIRGHYLGGLYPNMNHAIDVASSDIALFIQEDMQLVRDFTKGDVEHARCFFERYPNSLELHNCFFKRTHGPRDRCGMEIDWDVPVYFRSADAKGSKYFSAVGLFNVYRIRETGFRFSNFESGNDARIAEFADRMGIAPYPSMMWLPFAQTSKFRGKGILQRYAEWKTGAGFFPYSAMTDGEVARLFSRDIQYVPIAEEWLSPIDMRYREIWNFVDAAKFVPVTRKVMKMRKRFRRRIMGRQ